MEIKDILKNKRETLGLTCEDVGKRVGVSPSTISRWERGDIANMKRDKIAKLAEVLKISPSVIMGWDEPEYPSYYDDPEIQELADFMHKNPEYKVLFDASKNVKKEDIEFVREFMDRMRGEFDDTGC